MDILSMLQGKLGEGDLLGEIASSLGLEQREVEQTAREGLPAMMEGMRRNAESGTEGAASLAKALADHARDDVRSVRDVDVDDGRKILGHIFSGSNEPLAQKAGIFDQKKGGILSMLAPILMSALGQKTTEQNVGISDLGSIFGGGSGGGILGSLTGFLDKDKDGSIMDNLGDLFKR